MNIFVVFWGVVVFAVVVIVFVVYILLRYFSQDEHRRFEEERKNPPTDYPVFLSKHWFRSSLPVQPAQGAQQELFDKQLNIFDGEKKK